MKYTIGTEYPITELMIRERHPNTCFPAPLEPRHVVDFGYFPVIEAPMPVVKWKIATEGVPYFAGVEWRQTWVLSDMAPEQIISELTMTVQSNLDLVARSRGYDGILSACSYAADPLPKFSNEGRACVAWRGATWAACYAYMEKVFSGQAPIPTPGELISLLPSMEWPS